MMVVLDGKGQSSKVLVEGKITNGKGRKLTDARVLLISNNDTIAVYNTSGKGMYQGVEIPMGFDYLLVYTCEDFLSKAIEFNLRLNFYEEDSYEIIPLDVPMVLIRKEDVVDYNDLESYYIIGRVVCDPFTGGVKVDTEFTSDQVEDYKKRMKKK